PHTLTAWLNNCVGHWNHRYFFLFMIYTVLGCAFLMTFGLEIVYKEVYLGYDPYDYYYESQDEGGDVVVGFPVHIDHTLPKVINNSSTQLYSTHKKPNGLGVFVALGLLSIYHAKMISRGGQQYQHEKDLISVFVALGLLSIYHAKMISRGETSIEALINKLEAKKADSEGRIYANPYNFGRHTNWRLFLGLFHGRSFWRHVLLPSGHKPLGDGLTWTSTYSPLADNIGTHFTWPVSCRCGVKKID
ncbi:palmitoyltransferase ZDHHC16B-like, partial [Diaphorina citri]|uniref:Palmitoyltransferase n=1 Tax=Diaphorina citri TaxID=121845 RepID=A0A3Q0ITR4_DIACI